MKIGRCHLESLRVWSIPPASGTVAGLAMALPTGDGSIIYVAEPETSIGIVRISQSKPACQLTEAPKSPAHDGNTITLESIGAYPPRPF